MLWLISGKRVTPQPLPVVEFERSASRRPKRGVTSNHCGWIVWKRLLQRTNELVLRWVCYQRAGDSSHMSGHDAGVTDSFHHDMSQSLSRHATKVVTSCHDMSVHLVGVWVIAGRLCSSHRMARSRSIWSRFHLSPPLTETPCTAVPQLW